MHKFNYFCSVVLTIALPLMIVILSSNLILRVSETYQYHFNDSQVIEEIPYNVTGPDVAGSISHYWSSLSPKSFQVYEENGDYKDPVFEKSEQQIMLKAKTILNIELAAGLLCFAVSLAIYIYLWKNGFKQALRNRYYMGAGMTVVLLAVQAACWSIKSFRFWIYDLLIGIQLPKEVDTLSMVLGDPFHKTYVIFISLAGVALLAVLTYVNHILTKPERIFY